MMEEKERREKRSELLRALQELRDKAKVKVRSKLRASTRTVRIRLKR